MKYKKYEDYLIEIAKSIEAGEFEIDKINIDFAIEYLNDHGINILSIVPNFKKYFALTQLKFNKGTELRKNMPRLTKDDMILLQQKLKSGELDVRRPFSKNTNAKNPYPEGLKGKEAEDFLNKGLKDGSIEDDIIKAEKIKISCDKLIPIQKQVYYDQVVDFFINYKSISNIQKLVADKFFLISADNYILDGHHRFGIIMLTDPKFIVNGIKIDLELEKLLKLTLAFGDALGNPRNK